ncbi:MAG: Rdx family protein [Planctomycetes bacterium]|nr:Rdx family protein [Planctomycetota bacterium]MBL7041708.1 Rdx family protein [Pirellulaceae bacterium]
MTEKLLSSYKQRIKGFELEPSGGGCFELTADGEVVYSKLQTGQFPDEATIVKEIGKRLGS